MRTMLKWAVAATLLAAAGGCGQNDDPLSLLGDPGVTPAIGLPFTVQATGLQTPFSSANDGFDITFSGVQSIVAPAAGVVTRVDNVENVWSITILHNARVSSRISRMGVKPSVRVGDKLDAGEILGTSQTVVRLSIFVDGNAVCPYSFLDATARGEINRVYVTNSPALCGN